MADKMGMPGRTSDCLYGSQYKITSTTKMAISAIRWGLQSENGL